TIGGTGVVTLTAAPLITNGLTITNTTGVTIPSVTGVVSQVINASAGKVIFGTANNSVTIEKGTLTSGTGGLAGAAADGAVTLTYSGDAASLVLAANGSITIAGTGSVKIGATAVLKGAGSTWTAGTDTVTFAATSAAAGAITGGTSATLTPSGANAELNLLSTGAPQALTISGTTKFTLDLSAAGKITFDATSADSTITLSANSDGIKLSDSLAIVGTSSPGTAFTGAIVDGTGSYNANSLNVSLVDGVIQHSTANAAAPVQIDRNTTAADLASSSS
ncbi:MAG: hypothetical protein LBF83_05465, partial [Spirochaetaceae bacterium]|nr:hypothetical protein [Spirochaetaceae bacterium]